MIDNTISFILTTLSGFLSGVLSSLVVILVSKKQQESSINIDNRIYISIDYQVEYEQKSKTETKPNSTDSTLILVLFGLFVYAYIKYNLIFYLVFLGFSIFLTTFLTTLNFYSIKNKVQLDRKWNFFWITSLIYSILIPFQIYLAMHPLKKSLMTNEIVKSFQTIHIHSLNGFTDLFYGVINLIYTIGGFFILFFGVYYSFLSLVHLTARISYETRPYGRISKWVIIRTQQYNKPIRNAKMLIIISILSFLLISGLAYQWITNLFSA